MSIKDIDKSYVSPIDKFLFEFDQENKKSSSQIKEIEKYRRIIFLRDNPVTREEQGSVWEAF